MRVEKVVSPPLDNNAYFLFDETSKLAAVVDPALAGRALLANSEKFGVKIVYILNTHGHPDSIADDESIRSATGAKIAIFEVDAPLRRLKDLPPDPHVSPGHGPETTIGDETWISDLTYPVV